MLAVSGFLPIKHYTMRVLKICLLFFFAFQLCMAQEANVQSVKVIGGNLYIGAKYNEGNDILIWFKKCMFNELMTFYRVGLAPNENNEPSLNPDREPVVNLNVATSDNIGPVLVQGGGWIGANHSYQEQGKIKTAVNLSYEVYADGKRLKDGDNLKASTVEVRVKNILFDPLKPDKNNRGEVISLSKELIEENVTYRIEGGNIQVKTGHTYKNEEERMIERYYGMQSMFVDENHIMTPSGKYNDFAPVPESDFFNRMDAPFFSQIIEKNGQNNTFQSTYLFPNLGLGNHEKLRGEDRIFIRSHGKSYHSLVAMRGIKGETLFWSGLYSWFVPIRNDDEVLIFTSRMEGKTILFVNCKKALSKPLQYEWEQFPASYEEIQNDETVSYSLCSAGVNVEATGAGILVLAF